MSKPILSRLGLVVVLIVAFLAYRPGLRGPFLFDDYANLPQLGATGPVDNPPALARYLTSGTADPTGRPIAMLSFLLDARDWPADPYPFKRTNLLLHLINGALLFAVLSRLGRQSGHAASVAEVAALFGTACWLLHPLFVSTTLYIVQREAMLPATFTLLGILAWLSARTAACQHHRLRSLLAWGAVCACTAAATLSKANGILLPALVLVLEYTIGRAWTSLPPHAGTSYRRGLMAVGWIPTVGLGLALLAMGVHGLTMGLAPGRPWSVGQRLMTEPRILWDYLRLLWLPHPFTAGVFNDQFGVSSGWLDPWTTPVAMGGLILLAAVAWRLRRRASAASAALLFFLVGHAVESTTVPLELYFEHRNYLPALLMFWPAGLWLARHLASPSTVLTTGPLKLAIAMLALLLPFGLAAMTASNAQVWGAGSEQAQLWARLNPGSARAQVIAAQDDLNTGHPQAAIARLAPLLVRRPDEVQVALNLVAAHCAADTLSMADLQSANAALQTSLDPGVLLVSWFDRAVGQASAHACRGFDLDALASLARAGMANPHLTEGRRQDLAHVLGSIALAKKDGAAALASFNSALAFDPNLDIALQQAAMLGSAGYPALGLAHLHDADMLTAARKPGKGMPMLHAWVLARQHYWTHEREHLEKTLEHDLAAGNPKR